LRPRFDEAAEDESDDAADDGPHYCDEKHPAADGAAALAERKKAHRDEEGFKQRCNHSRAHASNDPDQYVVRPKPHRCFIRETPLGLRLRPGRTTLQTAGLEAFERAAGAFAGGLCGGDVVALSGELGAGKTTFVRAVVRALHGRDEATSPTFTFWHRYPGSPPVEHLDFYRVEDRREALELGLAEAFESPGIVLVEWPERLPELLPARHTKIVIRGAGASPRELTIEPA
jgi:tRNA threonylcarbamoyl adenosine modification protein YjeE